MGLYCSSIFTGKNTGLTDSYTELNSSQLNKKVQKNWETFINITFHCDGLPDSMQLYNPNYYGRSHRSSDCRETQALGTNEAQLHSARFCQETGALFFRQRGQNPPFSTSDPLLGELPQTVINWNKKRAGHSVAGQ